MPPSVWLPGLFEPAAFLTALLQRHARTAGVPLDRLELVAEVLPRDAGQGGPIGGEQVRDWTRLTLTRTHKLTGRADHMGPYTPRATRRPHTRMHPQYWSQRTIHTVQMIATKYSFCTQHK